MVSLGANDENELRVSDPPQHPGGPTFWWRHNPLVEFAVDAFDAEARGEFNNAALMSGRVVAVANKDRQ